MRGQKTTVYDGGIRVPAFLRWPGHAAGLQQRGHDVDVGRDPVDLLARRERARPEGLALDGVSLWPLLTGRVAAADWPDRTLFFQWHRGDVPERFRAFAARDSRYKLVRAEGLPGAAPPAFELFDMAADPFEQHDIATAHPEVVARLKAAYSAWYDDVSRTRGYDPPRIHVGSPREPITILTRQDWRTPRAIAGPDLVGHWEIEVERAVRARVAVTLRPALGPGVVHLEVGNASWQQRVDAPTTQCVFESVDLSPGPGRLEAWIEQGKAAHGAWSVDVKPLD
jgi:hypothetical protein